MPGSFQITAPGILFIVASLIINFFFNSINLIPARQVSWEWRIRGPTELLGTRHYGVSGNLVYKYECETKIWPSTYHDVAVGTGTSYHIIVLRRYSPVRATKIRPKDMCSKAMKGQIIVLRIYGPVRATHIITKGTYNKALTGRMK